MVNLHQLESAAAASPDVIRIITRASELEITRGITVRPLPIWKLLKHDTDGALVHFLTRMNFWQSFSASVNRSEQALEQFDYILSNQLGSRSDYKFDLNEPPKSWPDVAKQLYPTRPAAERTPLLVTAMIHHDGSKRADDELDQLGRIVAESELPSIIEPGHDAILQLSPGDSVTARSKSGVLGGFLHDASTGEYFGITCAHVAKVSDKVYDTAGVHVGDCVASVPLVQNTSNVPCDPLKASTPLNKLDVALVQLKQTPPTSGLSATTSLRHGEAIDVRRNGATTRGFNIRSLVMSFQLLDQSVSPSARYCFERLVELYPQGSLTQPSDSGAWAYNSGGEWAAMIVGGDAISSFAVRYEHIFDWACNDAFSASRTSLTLY